MTEQQKTALQFANQAAALLKENKYEPAIRLCDDALTYYPNDFLFLFVRGLAKSSHGDSQGAIDDLTEASSCTKDNTSKSDSFLTRGEIYFRLSDYEKAEHDYQEAERLDPFNNEARYAKFILSAAKELFPAPKNKGGFSAFVHSLENLLNTVLKIKEKHLLRIDDDSWTEVAHFTKYEALKSMLPVDQAKPSERNCLRLYNIIYMNDPLEGRRLIEYDKNKKMNLLSDTFQTDDAHHKIHSLGKELGVYISSLTLRSDKLYLWRAYGNDGNGYCIITPKSGFKQELTTPMLGLGRGNETKERGLAPLMRQALGIPRADHEVPPTLYKVFYEDNDVQKTLEALTEPLKDVKKQCEQLTGTIGLRGDDRRDSLHALIKVILSEITFLYKHSEYAEEQEVRIIHPFAFSKEENGLHLDEQVPSRIYAKTAPFLFKEGSRIIIGPKVKEKVEAEHELKYRLAKNGFLETAKVINSEIRYR